VARGHPASVVSPARSFLRLEKTFGRFRRFG
jgi:hypothetical protein